MIFKETPLSATLVFESDVGVRLGLNFEFCFALHAGISRLIIAFANARKALGITFCSIDVSVVCVKQIITSAEEFHIATSGCFKYRIHGPKLIFKFSLGFCRNKFKYAISIHFIHIFYTQTTFIVVP